MASTSRTSRFVVVVAVLTLASCGSDAATTTDADTDPEPTTSPADDGLFPDVIDATATHNGDGFWTFSATLTSPYDTVDRYADGWRVLDPQGNELGVRVLTHGHASEQPFTRSTSGVEIPDGITEVTIEGRDIINGWGGATVSIPLDR